MVGVYDDLRPAVKGKYKEWAGERVRGTLTIGYGHTNAAKHPLKIKKGLRITEGGGQRDSRCGSRRMRGRR